MDKFVVRTKRKRYSESKLGLLNNLNPTHDSNLFVDSSRLAGNTAIGTSPKVLPNDVERETNLTDVEGKLKRKSSEFEEPRKKLKFDDSTTSNDKNRRFEMVESSTLNWQMYNRNNLNYAYAVLYTRKEADDILALCEREIVYNTGSLAQVKVYGKVYDIPRKQVAFGDAGISYTFSGVTVPANPWPDFMTHIRQSVERVSGQSFNFVLVNRYKDGDDHIGEHKDDEKDLVAKSTIASLSFGQPRDFVFKHQDSRTKKLGHKHDPVNKLGHKLDPVNKLGHKHDPVNKVGHRLHTVGKANQGMMSVFKTGHAKLDHKTEHAYNVINTDDHNTKLDRQASYIDPVTIELGHGSVLLMKHPTNVYWYHSLPKRKKARNVRVNMTFRQMVVK